MGWRIRHGSGRGSARSEHSRGSDSVSGPTCFSPWRFSRRSSGCGGGRWPLYEEGIEAARGQQDLGQEAQGWDLLGEDRQAHGDLDGAERALVEAFRLRVLHRRADLRFSYRRLGALRLARALPDPDARTSGPQGWRTPLVLRTRLCRRRKTQNRRWAPGCCSTNWVKLRRRKVKRPPPWQILERPWTRRRGGNFRTLPGADSSLVGANVALQHKVFDSFVEAAASEAMRSHNSRLAGESFMAEELNRASSFRDTQALAPVWRNKLPRPFTGKI